MRTLVSNFDITITRWILQHIPAQMQPLMITLTNMGDPIFTIGIAVVLGLYGLKYNTRLLYSSLMIPATLVIGGVIKFLVHRARPLNDFIGIIKVDTYSFPSGHSSGSVVAYGLLAYIAFMKLPAPFNYIAAGLLAIVPIAVGISRIYLGAHYPSDVLAGWILGLMALLVVIFAIKPLIAVV